MLEALSNPHLVATIDTLLGAVITVVCGFALYKIKKRDAAIEEMKKRADERAKSQEALIAAVTRYVLIKNFEDCMEKGYYPLHERDTYRAMYEQYISCGYNHIMHNLSDELNKLPHEAPRNRRASDKTEEDQNG